MAIRIGMAMDISRSNLRAANIRFNQTNKNKTKDGIENRTINVQDEINAASEEIADLLSTFGRFSKGGRRNDYAENEFASSILDDKADEKIMTIVNSIKDMKSLASFLNFARGLFPNDSDLLLALRELLLSKHLTEKQKSKIKEAILDIEKFCDVKKMNSGINVGLLAKKFSKFEQNGKLLSAKDLRNSYLRFLELDLPASYIYQDWIDEFGSKNRKYLLAFTLNALVADMKSSQPGIHFDEFGPLSTKLSDARIINTLDESLINDVHELNFIDLIRSNGQIIREEEILGIFFMGLTNFDNFKEEIISFSKNFTSDLLIKQRATLLQKFYNAFNLTPDFFYATPECREQIQEYMSIMMLAIYKKEVNLY